MRFSPRRKPRARVRRTTTDIPKNEYFSYHSNRLSNEAAARNSPFGKNRSGNAKGLPSMLPTLIMLLLLIFVGYQLTLSSDPKVVPLSVHSDSSLLRDPQIYREAAQRILRSTLVDHTKLTIDSNGFEVEMKKQFSELDSVALTLPLIGRRPLVQLAARTPALILMSQQGGYILDISGEAMIKAEDARGADGLKLTIVTDESNLPLDLGKGILTSQEITFIQIVLAQLNASKLQVESTYLPAIVNELRVKIKGQPYFIKFDMQNDPRTSVGTFLAAKQKFESDSKIPAEYVDARLEDRVFLK
jgi:hypothetical protein